MATRGLHARSSGTSFETLGCRYTTTGLFMAAARRTTPHRSPAGGVPVTELHLPVRVAGRGLSLPCPSASAGRAAAPAEVNTGAGDLQPTGHRQSPA